jgi:uncharacterized damage-inducible protein DinB
MTTTPATPPPSMIASLLDEFEHEAQTTRRLLERLPVDKLDWRPHEKSYTSRALASHIVDCIAWGDPIFTKDEFDVDPRTLQPYSASTVDDLLHAFDHKVADCKHALASVAADAEMHHPWRLKIMGRVRFEKSKAAVFRDFTLSHLIHHRGQLSVYLRLMNVPVPGSYGPTADEQF